MGPTRPGQGQHFSALPRQCVDDEEALGPRLPGAQGCSCGTEQRVAVRTDICGETGCSWVGGGFGMGPEYPTGHTLGYAPGVGDSGTQVINLTFVVAHGLLCHQLDAASGHHVMELVQEQEPAGAKGEDGEAVRGELGVGSGSGGVGRSRLTSRGAAAGLPGTGTGRCGPRPGC